MPTPTQILNGLTTIFSAITQLEAVLEYEPRAIHVSPTLYSIYRDYDRTEIGNSVVNEQHDWMHRVCITWAEPEAAEVTLHTLLNLIPAAVASDPTLNGVITASCYIMDPYIYDGVAGFARINKSTYRVIDFRSQVMVRSYK